MDEFMARPPDLKDDDDETPSTGGRNLITPAGLQALKDELRQLSRVERPRIVEIVSWAAGNGDRSENGDYLYGKKRLREIDRRIRFLNKRIEIAEPVDPLAQRASDRVFFGATVSYANERDEEITVTIVGVDEIDTERGRISWISPVARALLKAQVGDCVTVRTPSGSEILEILNVAYVN
jgi:transcription elongation factor GreB